MSLKYAVEVPVGVSITTNGNLHVIPTVQTRGVEQVFVYQGQQRVRTIIRDGEPWFVLKDVCSVLEIENTGQVASRLGADEKGIINIDTLGGQQGMIIISEPALYRIISLSRKPEAKAFQDWVYKEVLPTIRKTGQYGRFDVPQTYGTALQLAATQQLQIEAQQSQIQAQASHIAELQPKGEFYDTVTQSSSTIDMGGVAKTLLLKDCNGKVIGRNKLFKFLRDEGILMNKNIPYQEYVDNGCFKVVEIPRPNSTRIDLKTVVFQKGVDFIYRKWNEYHGTFTTV